MSLVKRTYVDGETVITAANLNDIQDEIIQNASDISTKGTYSKPSGGIPSTDMTTAVQTSLGKADTAYQKPSGGIPSTDLASAVQTSLGKADTALQSTDIDTTLSVTGKAADAKKTGDEISGVKNTLNHKADVIYDTASGDIASFPDGADGLPVKDLTVGIEPVQSGTGDPSPTNVRPISGWTGCNISHSGADTSDPTVIPISWQSSAGTVYGGTLDVTTGVLTVDRTIKTFTNNDSITWYTDQGWPNCYYTAWSKNGVANETFGIISKTICSEYELVRTGVVYLESGQAIFNITAISSASDCIVVKNDKYSSAADFKASLTTPLQLVYELGTPQTYQLTPTEVTTILGQNNIWADCGPSTVEYPCDTKLYIQKINAPTDDDMIADANIASGKYFIVNNNLYLSTAAILAGDPIKPGTNCTATNLAAALNAINS